MLSDRAYYAAHFMDLALWEPSVRMLCERHGFASKRVYPGIPGTFPTFIVEMDTDGPLVASGAIVVKFFGALFEGAHSYAIERAMGQYLTQLSLAVHSPAILAEGELTPEWQYLIFEAISGVSIGHVRQQLSKKSWVSVARQMGEFINGLHLATGTALPVIPITTKAMGWEEYAGFIEMQRTNCQANHQRWKDLPPQLLEQVPDYLLPVEELLDLASPPHIIHADLTGDHLLGRLVPSKEKPTITTQSPHVEGADWYSLAIIDWGDTRVGNILYELVALHMDLFLADKHLLHICLENYGLPDFYQQDFPHKALCMVLLHQFPMPAQIYAPYMEVQTLQALAEGLFDI
jgi:hypothetical protein